ncbi:MAG: hypothetical protein ACP5JP_08785 [bacterium]
MRGFKSTLIKTFALPLVIITLFFTNNIVYADSCKFTRTFDPVIIEGAKLSPFLGEDINNLRLYSVNKKGKSIEVHPIPFQIDELDEKGDWIFNFDKHGNPLPLKRTSLAPQDQLVFMAKDAGIKTEIDQHGFKGAKAIEIELTDPLNNTHAYVYLLYFKSDPPPLSPVHYVKYDPTKDMVTAGLYVMGFSKTSPISYDYYAVPKSAGGEGINIFDRFKMRLDIDTSLLNIHRDESQFKSRLVGYIQGPVRVIRRVANSMYIALGFQSPAVLSDSLYYYDFFQFPTVVDIPIDLQKLYIIKKARLITSTDFNHNAIGMYFYNSTNPGGLKITGTMSKAQEGLDRSPYDWAVVSGPQGAWMNRVVMGKEVPFTKRLYFVDDKNKLDPPENEPGQIANTGYDFGNLMRAKKGVYTFTSYIYVPVGYKPGDEKPWLNIIDHPVNYVIYYNGKQVRTGELQ